MSKIRGKDFAKTVIITPEENDAIQQRVRSDRRTKADRRTVAERRAAADRRVAVTLKGPRKGLSGWSIFFLIVVTVVTYYGIVAILMHLKVLPLG
jgi:hypothetical protein